MRTAAAMLWACLLAGCAADRDRPPRSPYAVEPQPARLAREERDALMLREPWIRNHDVAEAHLRVRGREPFKMFDQAPDSIDAWRRGVRAMHPEGP